jgi:signal transduction histidine kinase
MFPVFVAVLYLVGILSLCDFLRFGQIEAAVFSMGSLTVAVSLMHDIFVRIGVLETHVLAIGIAGLNFFVCTAFLLISRILSSKRALLDQNMIIERALVLRTAQLAQEFERQGDLREQNAAAVENQRMTSDLHDGVLTYLSMIQSLSENDPAENSLHINSLAKNATREIRVILEADLLDQNSIFVALSVLRNQVVGPLRNAGVVVTWDLLALLDQTAIDHRHALNLFRILQEGIHNAFQRAQCKVLVVTASRDTSSRKLIVSVTNSGGSGLLPQNSDGNGIRNMRRRAALMAATFTLTPSTCGARLELSFDDPMVYDSL